LLGGFFCTAPRSRSSSSCVIPLDAAALRRAAGTLTAVLEADAGAAAAGDAAAADADAAAAASDEDDAAAVLALLAAAVPLRLIAERSRATSSGLAGADMGSDG